MIMNSKVNLYRKCHKDLTELNDKRQIPLFNVDNEVKNRLIQDGAIRQNGMSCAINPKGDDLFLNKHYIDLAEKAEDKEREKELRERDSYVNQRLVEEEIGQKSIGIKSYKATIISIIIAVIGIILGLVKGCQ
jgi:hypothetical protein